MIGDIRYAIRALQAAPVVSIAAILSLVLGIGSATAVFSVIDGVLLKPFPVKDQERLLVVWTSKPKRGFDHWPFSYASYEGIRERLRTTSGVAAHPYAGTLSAVLHLDDGSAMPLQRSAVTGEWFNVLGVHPRAGRLLTTADDRTGAPHVIVLSTGVAERLFGSVEDAVGRTVRLQEDTFTVVGVAPRDFDYPRTAEAWVPAVWFRNVPEVAWDLIVRVAPRFTIEQTVTDLTSALGTLPAEVGPLDEIKDQVIHAQLFASAVVGDLRPTLLMLGGAVLLMLIVAGVNVANLLLVRGLARRRELSVRTAIGASHGRILRQLASEALVLAAVSAALAVPVAYFSLRVFLALAPPELPRLAQIGIDLRALAFVGVTAMVAAVLFGVLPVNEAFVRLFWPGKDPIGRRIKWDFSKSKSPWRTVVGVVADTRYRDLTSVRPSVYVPYEQGIPVSPTYLAVRTTTPATVANAIRHAVSGLEPGATVVSVTPLPDLLVAPLARPRFQIALVGSFAALGLLLSVIGTYGSIARDHCRRNAAAYTPRDAYRPPASPARGVTR